MAVAHDDGGEDPAEGEDGDPDEDRELDRERAVSEPAGRPAGPRRGRDGIHAVTPGKGMENAADAGAA
jgi:hypothetical protein